MDLLQGSQPIVQEGAKKVEGIVQSGPVDNKTVIIIAGIALLALYLYNKNKK